MKTTIATIALIAATATTAFANHNSPCDADACRNPDNGWSLHTEAHGADKSNDMFTVSSPIGSDRGFILFRAMTAEELADVGINVEDYTMTPSEYMAYSKDVTIQTAVDMLKDGKTVTLKHDRWGNERTITKATAWHVSKADGNEGDLGVYAGKKFISKWGVGDAEDMIAAISYFVGQGYELID